MAIWKLLLCLYYLALASVLLFDKRVKEHFKRLADERKSSELEQMASSKIKTPNVDPY